MRAEREANSGGGNAGDASSVTPRDWEATLKLGFACENSKTVLNRRSHSGPLMVQRPFYPGDGVCHVYLLHPPGGVVAGDRLRIDIAVKNDGRALVTTPAAGKFYRSDGRTARQTVSLRIEEGASLEWLPQETIVYEGARLTSAMEIELDGNARFIGWEVHALGRPASNEGFSAGLAVLNWSILLAGKPFYIERMELDAESFAARWGLNGSSSCATMVVYPASPEVLECVRNLIADDENLGVTRIDRLLICRGLDTKADRIKRKFQLIWETIRKDITGCEAESPRIWAT